MGGILGLKRLRYVFFLVWIICLVAGRGSISYADDADEPHIAAQSAILIEASTGRVIWEKQADDRHYPASMTKIMTALLGLDIISPHTEIFISPEAAATEDCPLGIRAGDCLTAEELLTGMMMVSDNGAAVAVAEQIDGSTAEFARRMNEKAQELGMEHTHFSNPNGLTDPNHYSTARDMARLAKYAMENPSFRRMVSQRERVIRWTLPRNGHLLVLNTNKLLGSYGGTTGIKTGWTSAAGGCLAASARRNGVELIAVLMQTSGPEERFTDAEKMLSYGFSHVRMVRGMAKEKISRRVWVKGGTQASTWLHPVSDIDYPLIHGEDPGKYSLRYDVPRVMTAPIRKGEVAGRILICYEGQPVGSVDMTADSVSQGFSIASWLVQLFEGLLVRL